MKVKLLEPNCGPVWVDALAVAGIKPEWGATIARSRYVDRLPGVKIAGEFWGHVSLEAGGGDAVRSMDWFCILDTQEGEML